MTDTLDLGKTLRGFNITRFIDRYGNACSLQESSVATEACIWLWVTENRMHLEQKHVKALLPYLQKFVETGFLGDVNLGIEGKEHSYDYKDGFNAGLDAARDALEELEYMPND